MLRDGRGSDLATTRIIEQVHGILVREGVQFSVAGDKRSFLLPVPGGSAAVKVQFHAWGKSQTMISLSSEVLIEVELTDENRLSVLEHLNALNQSALFGRFFLDADRSTIMLQYDLLGDDLDSSELLNALHSVGFLADQTDDELMEELGTGRRAADVLSLEGSEFSWDEGGKLWVDLRPAQSA
jgi:hypothetical protein